MDNPHFEISTACEIDDFFYHRQRVREIAPSNFLVVSPVVNWNMKGGHDPIWDKGGHGPIWDKGGHVPIWDKRKHDYIWDKGGHAPI